MPVDTKYIVSLRNPVTHYQAHFREIKADRRLNIQDKPEPALYYMKNSTMNETPFVRLGVNRLRNVSLSMKNVQSFLLGYDGIQSPQSFVNSVRKDFTGFLFKEYYDESLVLLRRKMCWHVQDIIYIKFNAANKGDTTAWSQDDEDFLVKKFSPVDHYLYTELLSDFNKEVSKQVKLKEEVLEFQQILHNVSAFCEPIMVMLKQTQKYSV